MPKTGKFHIGINGPSPCHAKKKCRLGRDAPHFETYQEANEYFEKELKKEFHGSSLTGFSRRAPETSLNFQMKQAFKINKGEIIKLGDSSYAKVREILKENDSPSGSSVITTDFGEIYVDSDQSFPVSAANSIEYEERGETQTISTVREGDIITLNDESRAVIQEISETFENGKREFFILTKFGVKTFDGNSYVQTIKR